MENETVARPRRWISYAACAWAMLFALPHTWWALGIPFGFPGGRANHELMMASMWRYLFDVIVVVCSVIGFLIPRALLRPPRELARRWVPLTAAWLASAMLTLRGVAGMVVDGTSDPVWWPAFLLGGILFGGVAWLARTPAPAVSGTTQRT